MKDETLEELIGDIFGAPNPQWFSDKWARHIVHWKEKADQLDKVQVIAGDSYNSLEKCYWIAKHTPEDFDTFWRQARFLEDINELWRKWKEDEITWMGKFIQELGKIMEDKQYISIQSLHRKVRK